MNFGERRSVKKLLELLYDEFQVPRTSQKIEIVLAVGDAVRISVNYIPAEIISEAELELTKQKFKAMHEGPR